MGYVGDSISHGMGCKECPPGRFVPPDAAPGKAVTECKSCPKGDLSFLIIGIKPKNKLCYVGGGCKVLRDKSFQKDYRQRGFSENGC